MLFEGVETADLDGAGRCEALSGEKAKEGGFAGAVVADSGVD